MHMTEKTAHDEVEGEKLKITKIFNTRVENVFEAWVNSEEITEWYGPANMTVDLHEMDAIEGGVFRMTMKGADGSMHALRGKYRVIDPPNKIVMTWQWEKTDASGNKSKETLVTVDFRILDEDRTEVTLTHEGLADAEDVKNHKKGWEESLIKLEDIFP